MVKTTLELKDEVYRKLVEESVKKYGNTKGISKMANNLIEEHFKECVIQEDMKVKATKGIRKQKK